MNPSCSQRNSVHPDVSIVIVSWNTRKLLKQCLRSIEKQQSSKVYEYFVVDNASEDGSAEMVAQEFSQVRLIKNETNVGFASANNQAIRLSRGRYVLLLNPDTIVRDLAINKTMSFMESEPEAGIVTCNVLNADLTNQVCTAEYFPSLKTLITGGSGLRSALSELVLRARGLKPENIDDQLKRRAHKVGWVMGAFMMIRRDVIKQVGVLDENLFMYGEEADLCYRASKSGWQMWFTPAGEIIHLGGQSTGQIDLKRTTDWLLTTSYYFFKKHHGSLYMMLMYFSGLLASSLKLLMYFILSETPNLSGKHGFHKEKFKQMRIILGWHVSHSPFKLLG